MWTQDKLGVLQKYLGFYTQALKAQPFELVYIDAFAGTGRCRIKTGRGQSETIDGSATIALNCAPAFSRYHFIEKKPKHVLELRALLATHANGGRAMLEPGRAEDALPGILGRYNWRRTRGVLFLDPYGLQCTWQTLERIRETAALDVFFLVSLSGLYRQAAVDEKAIDEGKAARLTAFLGTDAWRTALYTNEQFDFFDGSTVTRYPGYQDILRFTTERLRSLFPRVEEPLLLRQGNGKGAPLFALYFAVANPHRAAVDLAGRVARNILSKLRC
jgi:hypothetical protein